jgi:hypothetical protein
VVKDLESQVISNADSLVVLEVAASVHSSFLKLQDAHSQALLRIKELEQKPVEEGKKLVTKEERHASCVVSLNQKLIEDVFRNRKQTFNTGISSDRLHELEEVANNKRLRFE